MKKLLEIDSCFLCKFEGVDDIHDHTICTNIDPVKEVGPEIPDWCPLSDASEPAHSADVCPECNGNGWVNIMPFGKAEPCSKCR